MPCRLIDDHDYEKVFKIVGNMMKEYVHHVDIDKGKKSGASLHQIF